MQLPPSVTSCLFYQSLIYLESQPHNHQISHRHNQILSRQQLIQHLPIVIDRVTVHEQLSSRSPITSRTHTASCRSTLIKMGNDEIELHHDLVHVEEFDALYVDSATERAVIQRLGRPRLLISAGPLSWRPPLCRRWHTMINSQPTLSFRRCCGSPSARFQVCN